MADEGQRIEFGDKGPYLFQILSEEPQAMLLDEHDVCLLQFGQLYLPVTLDACRQMADALSNMTQADIGPEREGMIPLDFDLSETTELPLLTGAADKSFQHGETVYLDVLFDETSGRLCFSVEAASTIARIFSQIPAR